MNPFASALVTMRRSPYQSLASILILSFTFFITYSFSFFLVGSEVVLRFFETRPQVIAFFDIEANNSEINEIGKSMQEKDYVSGVKLVSKDEALAIYQSENKDDPLLLELVTAQILPASIEVSGNTIADLPKIKKDLDDYDNVDEVVLQQDVLDSLSSWTTSMRLVGLVSVGLLTFISLLIMVVVIGMKVVAKRPAIAIMRLIGATKWFIKSPFVFEGMMYGLLSSLIGWGLSYVGLLYITPWLKEFLGTIPVFPIPQAFYAFQISIGSLFGILLGAFAGSIAVGRLIKK
ncbi:MAG: FtsX-like permease family protein [Candidatus Pacebacteria bacterium]|nr:FtsX-like permease family protein [Candidatus Paceibacterota bacterium]